jgi:hypothetical protein
MLLEIGISTARKKLSGGGEEENKTNSTEIHKAIQAPVAHACNPCYLGS